MTLNDFLIKHEITAQKFAKILNVSVSAVCKWRLKKGNPEYRRPHADTIRRIGKVTKGKVSLDDWY